MLTEQSLSLKSWIADFYFLYHKIENEILKINHDQVIFSCEGLIFYNIHDIHYSEKQTNFTVY